MEEVITFIEQNYIWILIIIGVLLMALIGYIADKKGLGKNKKVKEKNNNEIQINKEVIKIPNIDDVSNTKLDEFKDIKEYDEQPIEIKNTEDIKENKEQSINDVFVEEIENNVESKINNFDFEENIDQQEINDSFEKIEVPEANLTSNLDIENEFNKLLYDVEESSDEISYELPKIDSFESTDLSEEDDIWKF